MALTKLNSYSLADDAVTAAKIADDAVVTALIADNAITSAKIGTDVIVAQDLAANSITVSEITDGVITEAKLNIDNSPTNDQVLTAKSSAAGGLTWAAAGGGGYSQAGSTVTPTSGQDNIEFTIPSGTNRIIVSMFDIKTAASGNTMLIQLSDDTAFKTSGYHSNGDYTWNGTGNIAGTTYKTNGAQMNDWTNTAFFGSAEFTSPDAGRRWTWKMSSSLANSDYYIRTYGHVDMGSGKDCRKLRFHSSGGAGFTTSGTIAVYYMEMGG